MSYWAIVQTHSQREELAAAGLERKGFGIYLPRIKLGMRRQLVPLFPNYLFVRIHAIWYPVLSTVGVIRLLRNGEREPSRIDEAIVREIRAREVRGVVRLPRRIVPGDRVRIVRGSFRDHIGVYEGMSGKEREHVLLELLGRKVRIEMNTDDFTPELAS